MQSIHDNIQYSIMLFSPRGGGVVSRTITHRRWCLYVFFFILFIFNACLHCTQHTDIFNDLAFSLRCARVKLDILGWFEDSLIKMLEIQHRCDWWSKVDRSQYFVVGAVCLPTNRSETKSLCAVFENFLKIIEKVWGTGRRPFREPLRWLEKSLKKPAHEHWFNENLRFLQLGFRECFYCHYHTLTEHRGSGEDF